ncbi:MAG: GNAT family N-acetyltransferase [Methanosarcina flavescens]|uniref:GNAT family N-acetyltransferase n=1 Tax=Methanosarcina flavescens TaxID=1715806 RepID=UPI001D05B3CA|nr:GNAT family N-acetyltransferase [Methanosarcina flavescens]
MIGNREFLAHKNRTLEIGYSLPASYHGRGYATEAVRSMVQWASSSLKRGSIIAYTYPI